MPLKNIIGSPTTQKHITEQSDDQHSMSLTRMPASTLVFLHGTRSLVLLHSFVQYMRRSVSALKLGMHKDIFTNILTFTETNYHDAFLRQT